MAQTPSTWDDYVGDGVEGTFQVTFPYQKQQEVFVTVDGAPAAFTFISAGWIQLVAVPASGAAIRVQRSTEAFEPRHEFENGVPLLPRFIDENNKQSLYVVQETVNATAGVAADALSTAGEAVVIAQAASDKVDAATLDSALVLRQELAMPVSGGNGAMLVSGAVSYVDTIADLRALEPVVDGQQCELLGHTVAGIGGGMFYADYSSGAADDNGATIVTTGGRRWVRRLGSFVSPAMFGAIGDGVVDDTDAVQAAIDAASAATGVVEFGAGTFSIGIITPKSNVTLVGGGAATTVVVQQPSAANIFTGFYLNGGQLENFHVRDVRFDGNRVANPVNPVNKIFYFRTNAASDFIRDVTWGNCEFIDAQEDFIRVLSSVVATVERVYAYRCSFRGTKLGLAGTGGNYPGNAFRFINVAGGLASNYGVTAGRFMGVIDCYAERIRTLGDFKRGSSFITIQGCKTKDMYDCHHSVDGAIGGIITGNGHYVSPGFDATVHGGTNTNSLEIQGEDIVVDDNVMLSDGARVTTGILITDYGYPEEGGVGHRSKNIKIINNTLRHIEGVGIKVINGVSCSVKGNSIEDVASGHAVAIDSGNARTDGTSALTAESCFVGGNTMRDVPLGVKLSGKNHVYSPNLDENGQDYFYMPGESLYNALTYADIAVVGGSPQINPNPHLVLNGAGPDNLIDFTNDEGAMVSADKPLTAVRGVTLRDTSTTANREASSVRLVPAKRGDRLYFRVWVKKGTANYCSVLVQELNSSGSLLLSKFHGIDDTPIDWTEVVTTHKVVNPDTKFLRISLVPATLSNAPASVGSTSFANFRVSRTMLGWDS